MRIARLFEWLRLIMKIKGIDVFEQVKVFRQNRKVALAVHWRISLKYLNSILPSFSKPIL